MDGFLIGLANESGGGVAAAHFRVFANVVALLNFRENLLEKEAGVVVAGRVILHASIARR